jgi:N4-gp56 family major capsid protein
VASAKASLYAVRKAGLRLENKNAIPFADGYFVGYGQPNFFYILRRDPSWKDWQVYQNSQETMYQGEVGRTEKIRWIRSTLCPRYAVTAHSVNITFIFGQEAFGATEAFGGVEIFKVSGADKSDPANQLTKYAFKLTGAAKCLNPSAGVLLFTHELL